MVNNALSYFDITVLKIQPLTHDCYTHIFSFFTEDRFYFLRIYKNMGLVLSSVMLVFLLCTSI